jgi:zinc transport system permease protein
MLESLRTYLEYPFVRHALVAGVMIALCSSLLGVTLVLKRFSLIGDGLSHVAFGALAVASILRLAAPMVFVLPATVICAVALLCASRDSRIRGDASIAMLSVGSLAIGYLLLNLFGKSSNLSGDVCTTLFGSTSILTLSNLDVWLCAVLSMGVVVFFILFYERIFAITFDETSARAGGVRTGLCNLFLAVVVAVIIVLAMNLVGSLLISALIVFPALAAMRICRSFLGVTICAAVLSVVCALIGMLTAILGGTPVGSTIVAADMLAFLLCAVIGLLLPRLRLKRMAPAALCLMVLFTVSCGSKQTSQQSDKKEDTKVSEQKMESAAEVQKDVKIDVDLTKVNTNMVYVQVFYMMQKPQDYNGQTIRLPGVCTIMKNKTTQQRTYNCNVLDGTGCCAKMIPFKLADANAAYPKSGEAITVTGKFQIVTENDKTFGVLNDAVVEPN